MNYRRVLVTRWSRRDWLAVLVVALVAALLVGTTVLVAAASDETTAIADDLDANATVVHYESLAAARAEASDEGVVLPMATASSGDGQSVRAVGIPDALPDAVDLPPPSDSNDASGPVARPAEWRLDGADRSERVVVAPGGDAGVVPESWVRIHGDRIEAVGATGALLLEPTDTATSDEGTPLVGVLSFFVGGTNDVIGLLANGIVIAGVVVAVTVWSVVRMLISDRARTIRVARATGAPPRRINTTLAARAGLLTGVGVVLGYAVGIIVPNVAINVAVFLGFPTTLSLQVTPTVVSVLAGALGGLTVVGVATGYLAAHSATAVPVAQVSGNAVSRSPGWTDGVPARLLERCWPALLSPRAILPTTATLSAFAIVVLLIAALGGVGASLETDATTIADPEAPHLVASDVPESYAGAVDDAGVAASPEILLFGYRDGQPYLARGGEYDRFAAVTGASLRSGTAPTGPGEAVVGVRAAETMGLEPGDTLTMGGSTTPAVAHLEVVGVYETGGIDDHQVFVPLETARHLSTVREGQVNIIRTETAIDTSGVETPSSTAGVEGGGEGPGTAARANTSLSVLGVAAPRYTTPGEPVQVEVSVWNPAGESRTADLTAALGEARTERAVTLEPRERQTVTLEIAGQPAGEYELAVGNIRQPVAVTDTAPLTVRVPDEVPPGERVQVRVTEETGAPVSNGTVAIGDEQVPLAGSGTAWVRVPEAQGSAEVVVRRGGQETRKAIQVTGDATRQLAADIDIEPAEPTVHVRPTASVELRNPWNRTVQAAVTVEGPGVTVARDVGLDAGGETGLTAALERRPPGEYTVVVAADGRTLATGTYAVSGDERLAAALAASGHDGGGLGGAIEYAIGNLSVLLAALVALAAVTTVGALSAVLARAVRTKRHAIGVYRATGASAGRILRIVLTDTLRIGVTASLLALGIAVVVTEGLAALGQLTAFGIALSPWPSWLLAGGILAGGTGLALGAALVATLAIVRTPVQRQLSETTDRTTPPAASTRADDSGGVEARGIGGDDDADTSTSGDD